MDMSGTCIMGLAMTARADPDLFRMMAAGDPEGLAELYDRYAPAVYAAAVRLLRNLEEAEDTVQEVFADAWYEATRLASRGANAAEWLLTAARDRAAARLASRREDAEAAGGRVADAAALPSTLRRRVLDSVYGAGQRLPALYSRPKIAERLFGWVSRRRSRASPDRSEEGGT
jgi:DNA-directed RNA polymerase specialized sigma24 family protein